MKEKRMTGLAVMVYLMVLLITLEAWGQVPATGISMDRNSITLNRGAEVQVSASLTPENASQDGVQWQTENNSVATVSPASGNPLQATVKGVSAGTTSISVVTAGGHTATASISVVVPVTGVSIQQVESEVIRGEVHRLTATVQPGDASNKNLRWISSDPETIRIIESGSGSFGAWHTIDIEAMEAGKATISVETQDGGRSAVASIEVIVLAEAVVFEKETMEMNSGEEIQPLYEILPADATNQGVWFESTEPSVATVTGEGVIEAHGEGAARIIVRSDQDRMIFDHLLILVDGAEAPAEENMILSEEMETSPEEDPPEDDPMLLAEEEPEVSDQDEQENSKNNTTLMIGAALVVVLVGLVMIFRKNSSGEMKKQPPVMTEEPTPADISSEKPLQAAPAATEEEQKIPGRAVVWGISGEFEGQGIELAENLLIIGRDAMLSHVVYPSHREEISRKHVMVEFDPDKGNCWITDLSANGTYLEETGERLPHDEKTEIRSGERFYLVDPSELFEVEI